MLYKLSSYISNKLVQGTETDAEVVAYGLEMTLSTIISILLLYVVAFILGITIELTVFVLSFGVMRGAAGGMHAKNHIICFGQYLVVSIGSIYLAQLLGQNSLLTLCVCVLLYGFSLISVFKYAPVGTANRDITQEERMKFKKRSRVVAIIMTQICVLAYALGYYTYFVISSLAVFSESISLLPAFNKGDVNDET